MRISVIAKKLKTTYHFETTSNVTNNNANNEINWNKRGSFNQVTIFRVYGAFGYKPSCSFAPLSLNDMPKQNNNILAPS